MQKVVNLTTINHLEKAIQKKSEQYRGPRLNGWAGAVMTVRTLKSKA